jgi:hypothetical protein
MKISAMALTVIMAVAVTTAAGGHDGNGGLTLEPQQSVEAIALGGTGLSRTGIAEGFGVNPAGLPLMRSLGIGFARSTLIEGVTSSVTSAWLAAPLGRQLEYIGSEPAGRLFGVGLSLDHRSLDLAQGSGWSSDIVSVGFGYSASTYASAGILVKYLFTSSDITGTQATGFGLDLAGRVDLTPSFDFGLAVRNLLGTTAWEDGEDESPPVIVSLGGTLASPYGTYTDLAVTVKGSEGTKIGLGLEVPVMGTGFRMRGGYQYWTGDESRNVISAGIGFQHLRYRIAYAARFDDETALGTTHHFSLGTDFR